MFSKWWLLTVLLLLLAGGDSSALPWPGQRARPQDTAPANKPDRKAWSQVSSPLTAHMFHAAVVVDARVYVVGGRGDVEVFDPKRNSWESLGKNPSVRNFAGAAALGKQIYVVGGVDRKKNLATVDVFDA